ncbi:hypothetical protein JTB14_008034 [Gonioctena quinquepunctata]|nr:hypothetical protein JTB14_008034 [Gonioctena quinquepunctata]
MQSFENLLQHPPRPQQIGVEIDNVEVLFVDNKENSSGGGHVSCTPTVEIGEGLPWSITTSSTDSPRSFKRSHEDTSTDSEGNKGQMKRARREIKIRHNYSASPSNLLRKLKHANVRTTLAQKKVKVMKVKVDRLKKKVTSLKQILLALKRKELVSENGLEFLEKSITGVPLSLMKRTIEVRKRKLQGKKLRDKFSDDLKTFAMTLQFLSSKAYLNNWSTCGVFVNGKGEKIDFKFIIELHELQEEEFCNLANKIGRSHIDWRSQKMKVNLAAQTLSASVANALEFLSKDLQHPDFKDAAPTIEFIRIIDRLFDLLNSRNPFAKGYKTPLKKSNESFWKPILEQAFEFLISLKHVNGELDHLELFFCAIRGRNGWNNNPTAFQFYYSFRRLCMNIDLKVLKGNCEILDDTTVLGVLNPQEKRNLTELCLDDLCVIKKYDIDYNDLVLEDERFVFEINVLPSLSLITENVVTHISGFVVKSVRKLINCTVCLDSLAESDYTSINSNIFKLLHRKDRGGLIKPSKML